MWGRGLRGGDGSQQAPSQGCREHPALAAAAQSNRLWVARLTTLWARRSPAHADRALLPAALATCPPPPAWSPCFLLGEQRRKLSCTMTHAAGDGVKNGLMGAEQGQLADLPPAPHHPSDEPGTARRPAQPVGPSAWAGVQGASHRDGAEREGL